MAIEYFGQCNSDGTPTTSSGEDNSGSVDQLSWIPGAAILACPGSGTYDVKSLGVRCKCDSAETGYMSIGIYTYTTGAKICETDLFSITNTSYQWNERSDAYITGTKTLTGGVNYILAWYAKAGIQIDVDYTAGSSGDLQYFVLYDYSYGLPSTLPSGLDWTGRHIIRCGVEAAGGASSTQHSFRFRNDDGDEDEATWRDTENTNIYIAKE